MFMPFDLRKKYVYELFKGARCISSQIVVRFLHGRKERSQICLPESVALLLSR